MFYSEEENIYKKSAYDLLKEEEIQTPIVTFSAAFDNMIGGGIPIGKITEICGAPGLGKTQFGLVKIFFQRSFHKENCLNIIPYKIYGHMVIPYKRRTKN